MVPVRQAQTHHIHSSRFEALHWCCCERDWEERSRFLFQIRSDEGVTSSKSLYANQWQQVTCVVCDWGRVCIVLTCYSLAPPCDQGNGRTIILCVAWLLGCRNVTTLLSQNRPLTISHKTRPLSQRTELVCICF